MPHNWGGFNELNIEKDKNELKRRLNSIIHTKRLETLQLVGKLFGRLKKLDTTFNPTTANKADIPLEKELADLLSKKDDLLKKASTGNEEQFKKLQDEFNAIESNLFIKNKQLIELETFSNNLFPAIDRFTTDLKLLYATNGEDPEIKKQYDKSYNDVVDQLVKIDAFTKDKNLHVLEGGVALWSKLNQRYAELLSKETKKITLESSLAGYLFDGLSWGTTFSIDQTAPLKQFWMRMSREIAKTAVGKAVDLHVLKHVVEISAFYTDEWPKIEASIKEKTIEALHLYKYELQDVKERDIYVWSTLNANELEKEKYNNSYIFSRDPPSLLFKNNDQIETLKIENKETFDQLMQEVKASDNPLQKGQIISKHPLRRELPPPIKLALEIISKNPGHSLYLRLKGSEEPIVIKSHEDLKKHVADFDEKFKEEQQGWHMTQTVRGKLDMVIKEVLRQSREAQETEAIKSLRERFAKEAKNAPGSTSSMFNFFAKTSGVDVKPLTPPTVEQTAQQEKTATPGDNAKSEEASRILDTEETSTNKPRI